jgi:Mg2+ and Co2+ transporter CorA
MDKYDGKEGTATDLLTYYFKTLFKSSGLEWNSDNDAEIEALIEAIIESSKSEIDEIKEEIAQHKQRIKEMRSEEMRSEDNESTTYYEHGYWSD